ncbi:hypothetical protein WJX81_004508 [Elliptochloris bilobata]|uniref:Uncharacterized protein n=1 Tax=Elliptochloris bilobata TaxID=381761 RepID=A0AAW1S1V9_9CHLO
MASSSQGGGVSERAAGEPAASSNGEPRRAVEEEDDASRYPDRNQYVGGWAGGETGLRQWIEEAAEQSERKGGAAVTRKATEGSKSEPVVVHKDGEQIYIGYDKENIDSRRQGAPGRYIQDDINKYPAKESIGPLSGVTGGFAGGERGLQQLIEKGKLKLAEPGSNRRREFSSLLLAGGVAATAVAGGLLLDDGLQLGEKVLGQGGLPGVDLRAAPLDGKVKLVLQAAVALMAVGGGVFAVRGLVRRVREGTGALAGKALDAGKVAVFWVAVFAAVKFVLESS